MSLVDFSAHSLGSEIHCLQCFDTVGWASVEHQACKKIEWWGTGMVVCLERGTNDLHMVQLMPMPPYHSLFY